MRNIKMNSIWFILATTAWLVVFPEVLNYHNSLAAQKLLPTDADTNTNLKTYVNEHYKITISYPAKWDKIEFAQGITEGGRQILVTFLSPQEGPSDSFREYMTIEVADLPRGSVVDNSTLIQYAEKQFLGYDKSLRDFHSLANSNQASNPELNIAGHKCLKQLYSYVDATAGKINSLQLSCLSNSKIYIISFQSDSNKYSLYLPVVKQMINSINVP